MKTVNPGNFASIIDFFLSANSVFVVPTFQRPYAWQDKHIQALLEDIAAGSRRKPQHHYLSPIHLIPIQSSHSPEWGDYTDSKNTDVILLNQSAFVDDSGNPLSVYLVIDGQQRLTTLFSFFSIILPRVLTISLGNQMVPRLILNPFHDHCRFKELLGLPTTGPEYPTVAQERLNTCFQKAKNMPPEVTAFLRNKGFQFLIVELNAAYGLQAFQTQNDRGKPLTNLERLKSLFMEYDLNHCEQHKVTQINSTFGKLYRILDQSIRVGLFNEGESGDNEFLQLLSTYIRISRDSDSYWQSAEKVYHDYFKKELRAATDPQSVSQPSPVSAILDRWLNQTDEVTDQLDQLNKYLSGSNLVRIPSSICPNRCVADDYEVILKSLKLGTRSTALLLALRRHFRKEWHDKVIAVRAKSNIDIVRQLNEQLERISTALGVLDQAPVLITEKIQVLRQRVGALLTMTPTTISPLEIVERIEYLIFKLWNPQSSFANCWRSVFDKQDSPGVDHIAQIYNWFWRRDDFISRLLYGSGDEGIYQYLLREYEAAVNDTMIHFNNNLQFEHIFPVNPRGDIAVYGFPSHDKYNYNLFIGKIGNRAFIDGGLNEHISNEFPDFKAAAYGTQAWDKYVVPQGNQVKSAIKLGIDLEKISGAREFIKPYLELRGIELAIFAAERFW